MELYTVKARIMRQVRAKYKPIHDVVNVLHAHGAGS